jgi:hypothetical protein
MIGEIMNWKRSGSGSGLIKALSAHLPAGNEDNHENLSIAGVLAEIRTKQHPNTSLDRYYYTNLF